MRAADVIRPAFLPFRRITNFQGRSRRSELLGFVILWVMLELAVIVGAVLVTGTDGETLATPLLRAALALPAVGLGIRRLHDSGLSGWWLLLAIPAFNGGHLESLVPEAAPSWFPAGLPYGSVRDFALYLPSYVFVVLLARSGEPDSNRYGPDPRDASAIAP